MRWRRRRLAVALPAYEDDGSLPVLVTAADPARADSDVLAEAMADGIDVEQPLLIRHHLQLPDQAAVTRAADLLSQDSYRVTVTEAGPPVLLRAWRTQVLTAMSASQERSRMAGLAQRLGGDVEGWDACGPPR